jgi:predicted porin
LPCPAAAAAAAAVAAAAVAAVAAAVAAVAADAVRSKVKTHRTGDREIQFISRTRQKSPFTFAVAEKVLQSFFALGKWENSV